MDPTEKWLTSLGLERYAPVFAENDVDLDVLPELTDADLKELGVSLGHRKKMFIAIAALRSARINKESAAAAKGARQWLERDSLKEAERRQLTVMFCDLVGFTSLANRLDPEDLRDIIRAYQSTCTAAIEYFDGYVSRYMGDGILAYFGYPHAHEDDAERAVLAGLNVIESLRELDTVGRTRNLELAVRIGIATGTVVVGDLIGKGTAEERAVTGGAANLANRLQEEAAPNTVVTSSTTMKLASGRFDYEDLGERVLKGIAGRVHLWRVAGERHVETRFEASRGTSLTPLVGRHEEVELLARRWERSKSGEGQVMLIAGEPGIGKSRLIHMMRERVAKESQTNLLYQCSPYHTNSALHPITNQLKAAARFSAADSAEERLAKLEKLVSRSSDDLEKDLPLVAALLSVPTLGRYAELELDAKRQKEQILTTLVRQLEGLSEERSVLCVFEDVQWVDPSTMDLLETCVERVKDLPVLLAMTFRPEFEPPWMSEAHTSFMALKRMDRRDSAELVQQVAGRRRLPEEVLSSIVAKTDGVPLFAEEFTKAVLESGLLEEAGDHFALPGPLPALAIPASLRDSLMARLDRLGPVKEVALLASILGRTFTYRVLSAVARLPEKSLDDALERLVHSELVYRKDAPPDETYEFKHALVQEEAYSSLLRSKRLELHARVAEVLQSQFPEIAESQPELLAHHYQEAGNAAQAVAYWLKAGKRSTARTDFAEARQQLQNALTQLRDCPASQERTRTELEILITTGTAVAGSGAFSAQGSGEAYRRALALCEELGDLPEVFPVLSGAGSFYMTRADFEQVRKIADDCLARAKRQDSLVGRVIGHRLLGGTLVLAGRFEAGCAELARVLSLISGEEAFFRDSKNAYALDHKTTALCYQSLALTAMGRMAAGIEAAREGLRHAESTGNRHSINYALCYLAAVLHIRGDDAEALSTATRSRDLALEHGFASWIGISRGIRGEALMRLGNQEDGLAEAHAGRLKHTEITANMYLPFALSLEARALAAAQRADEALALLDEALAVAERTGERWYLAELCRLQGVVHAQAGNTPDAEERLGKALEVAEEQGARLWSLRSAVDLGKLWHALGRDEEVRSRLWGAYTDLEGGDKLPEVREARRLLAVAQPQGARR